MVNKKIVGKRYLIGFLFIIFLSSGCAEFQDLHYTMLKAMRTPGEIMEKNPEETSQDYFEACKDLNPNMVQLSADVIPRRVMEGREVNHRIRFAICRSKVKPVEGEIIRKVYFGSTAVFQDRTRYEFKQGTWVIDAFIKVPVNAGIGVYEVDTVVSYRGKSTRIRNTFEVKLREPDSLL
jgi:hypothetical protein